MSAAECFAEVLVVVPFGTGSKCHAASLLQSAAVLLRRSGSYVLLCRSHASLCPLCCYFPTCTVSLSLSPSPCLDTKHARTAAASASNRLSVGFHLPYSVLQLTLSLCLLFYTSDSPPFSAWIILVITTPPTPPSHDHHHHDQLRHPLL